MTQKPKASPREKSVQFVDGKAYRFKLRKDGSAVFHTECCACGLTHLEQYSVKGERLVIRVWVEDEMTEKARKGKLRRLRRAP